MNSAVPGEWMFLWGGLPLFTIIFMALQLAISSIFNQKIIESTLYEVNSKSTLGNH